MGYMTAEQAIEAAKGLTFEKVWAALMESRRKMDEYDKQRKEEVDKQIKESNLRIEESFRRMEKTVSDLSKNIGGLGNSFGRFTEVMFSSELCDKFNELGYTFNTQANNKRFNKNGRALAEVDSVLENGDYVMLVEIKTDLSIDDVDDHLKRIGIVRQYMDENHDNRKIIGAAAGGIVSVEVRDYAQKCGFFVVVQNGDAVKVADMPGGFTVREW